MMHERAVSFTLFAGCCAAFFHDAQRPLGAPPRVTDAPARHAVRVSELSHELEVYIDEIMQRWHVPGLSVAVVQGNETWAKVRRSTCSL